MLATLSTTKVHQFQALNREYEIKTLGPDLATHGYKYSKNTNEALRNSIEWTHDALTNIAQGMENQHKNMRQHLQEESLPNYASTSLPNLSLKDPAGKLVLGLSTRSTCASDIISIEAQEYNGKPHQQFWLTYHERFVSVACPGHVVTAGSVTGSRFVAMTALPSNTCQLVNETTNTCPNENMSVLNEQECTDLAPSMCANNYGNVGAWNHDPVGCFVADNELNGVKVTSGLCEQHAGCRQPADWEECHAHMDGAGFRNSPGCQSYKKTATEASWSAGCWQGNTGCLMYNTPQ